MPVARHRRIGEVAVQELDLRQVLDVARVPGDQAVDDAHALAAADELFDEVRTDEAGAAGDDVESHGSECKVLVTRSS